MVKNAEYKERKKWFYVRKHQIYICLENGSLQKPLEQNPS